MEYSLRHHPLFPSAISAESMDLEIEHDQLFTELQYVQDSQQYNLDFGFIEEIYVEDRIRDIVCEHVFERVSVENAKIEFGIYNQKWASILHSPLGSTNLEISLPIFANHEYTTQKQHVMFFTREFDLIPSPTYDFNNIGPSDNTYGLLPATDTSRIEPLIDLRE
ncbi:hypothetical protein B7494_g157 [Chlorociboria aeruginascens]|nr:hypothetical protein B7494_g157 [Chlorociboria aeruginascens]